VNVPKISLAIIPVFWVVGIVVMYFCLHDNVPSDIAKIQSFKYGSKVIDHAINETGTLVTVRFDSSAIGTIAWGYPDEDLLVCFVSKPDML